MFVHFGRLLLELLKFSTLSPDQMRRVVEFEGEDRSRAAYAQGKGVLFFTGHFGYWELQAIVQGLKGEPIGGARARARQSAPARLLEADAQRDGQHGDLSPGRGAAGAQGAARAARRWRC